MIAGGAVPAHPAAVEAAIGAVAGSHGVVRGRATDRAAGGRSETSALAAVGRCAVVALLVATALACEAPGAAPGTPGRSPVAATGTPGDPRLLAADGIVSEWVVAERIPGAVLLVSRAGNVVLERAYGQAQLYRFGDGEYGAAAAGEARPDALQRLAEPVPMRTDTIFDLASLTKVMATTFAVMLLVDDGALELDAPVQRYLPDFGAEPPAGAPGTRGGATAPRAGTSAAGAAGTGTPAIGDKATITLRQLLTHRSGLSQWQPIYYSARDTDGAYRFIRDFPLAWRPGTERHYSDLGFMLLGILVERVSGSELGEFLQAELYEPLGLTATGFRGGPAPPGAADRNAPSAGGTDRGSAALPEPGVLAATSHGNPFEHHMVYDPDFGYRIDLDPTVWNGWRRYTLVGEVNDGNAFYAFGGEAGHAGLFSSARDLQVLLQLLLNGGEYGGRRYLSAAVVERFLTDTGEGQALGWQVPADLPDGSFHHTGFTGTYVAGVPAARLAIVLLTNRQNVGLNEQGQYADLGELQLAVARAVIEGR